MNVNKAIPIRDYPLLTPLALPFAFSAMITINQPSKVRREKQKKQEEIFTLPDMQIQINQESYNSHGGLTDLSDKSGQRVHKIWTGSSLIF